MGTKKKVVVWLAGAAGGILLGAIGSGLWERCMSRIFDALVRFSINSMSLIIKSYKDTIYLEAAKGFHEYSALFLHTIFIAIVPALYLIILWLHPYKHESKSEGKVRLFVRSKKGYYVLITLTIAVAAFFALDLTRISYTNQVITYAEQAIIILAPKVPDVELRELRASFASIRSESEFGAFRKRLNRLAEMHSVKLPKLKEL